MKNSTILFWLLISLFSTTFSAYGNNFLRGVLLDAQTDIPIKNARVWLADGTDVQTNTGEYGSFKLNLAASSATYQAGDEVEVYVSDVNYGFHKTRVTIPKSRTCEIRISMNNLLLISGVVVDERTGTPLSDVEVTIFSEMVSSNSKPQVIKTGHNGEFSQLLHKGVTGAPQYFKVTFRDITGRYEFKDDFIKVSDFTKIEMERGTIRQEKVKVKQYQKAMKVSAGDAIEVKANGSIIVGKWVGNSTPIGTDGVLGLPLGSYSIFPQYSHAALLYKFSWEDRNHWHYCGNGVSVKAIADGYLEFMVNDKKLEDNYGSYDVSVTIH